MDGALERKDAEPIAHPIPTPQHSGRYLSARRILRNLGKRAIAIFLVVLSYALAAFAAYSLLHLTATGRRDVLWPMLAAAAGAALAGGAYALDEDVRGGSASAAYLHAVFLVVCGLMLAGVW